MDTGQQTFQPMTTHLQKVANNDGLTGDTSSSHSKLYSSRHLHPHPQDRLVVEYPQRPYSTVIQESYPYHTTYAMQQPHAAQSSEQRVHDPGNLQDRSSIEYPPYVDEHRGGNDIHSHMSYDHRADHQPRERYPNSPEPTSASTYPDGLDTPPKFGSFPVDDQHQSRQDESLVNYRQALRGYHAVKSSTVEDRRQQQQHEDAPRDDHGHFRGRHLSSLSPPPYIPFFTDGAKDYDAARRSVPYQQNIPHIHPSSSIPMSNRPPLPSSTRQTVPEMDFEPDRNLRHDDFEDSGRHRQDHHDQSRNQNRYLDIAARNQIPSLSAFYPNTSEHDGRRRNTSPSSVSDSLASLASLPPRQHQNRARSHSQHPRSRSTPDPPSGNYDHLRRSSTSSSHSYHGHHQQQSISSHARSRNRHSRGPLFYPDHDKSLPNEDRRAEDPYARDVPMDVHSHPSSTSINVPSQTDGQIYRSRSDMGMRSSTDSMSTSAAGVGDMISDPGQAPVPVKKKKKSKMHECEVCQKKFPRPSGLKTHMNTHNNEKPYSCGFPGCTRTFGVRSNAKRHLRTHGVIPQPAAPSGQVPYVVGFETPVVLPHHLPDGHDYSQSRGGLSNTEGTGGEHYPASRQMRDEGSDGDRGHPGSQKQRQEGAAPGGPGHLGGAGGHRPAPRIPTYKVRWMPPSLMSRTNAQDLREVADGDEQRHMEHDHDREADYAHNFEDRYRLNLRHSYDHAYEHGNERGREQERGYDHPNSRPTMRERPRWREDGEDGMSSSGRELDYDQDVQEMEDDYLDPGISHSRLRLPLHLQSHSPSFDTDHSPSPANALPSASGSEPALNTAVSGSRTSSVSFPSRVCICSPPCPVDSSGSILCQMSEIRDQEGARSGRGHAVSESLSNLSSSSRTFVPIAPSPSASASLSPIIPPAAGVDGNSGFSRSTVVDGEITQEDGQGSGIGRHAAMPQFDEGFPNYQTGSHLRYSASLSKHRGVNPTKKR